MKLGIVAKVDAPGAAERVGALVRWLALRGTAVAVDKETGALLGELSPPACEREALAAEAAALVVFGGDGTLLSVARSVGDRGIPILGINLGGLGFLTATSMDAGIAAVEALLGGAMPADERMLLRVRILRPQADLVGEHLALNDVVIGRAGSTRLLDLSVSVDGRFATAYRADGLIVSTPTGSTAYSLSAGGPILHPAMAAIVLTPICSHTLTNRPIVLPATQAVAVRATGAGDATLTVDGQVAVGLRAGDTVEVVAAGARVRLARFAESDFFTVLRTKLKWGER